MICAYYYIILKTYICIHEHCPALVKNKSECSSKTKSEGKNNWAKKGTNLPFSLHFKLERRIHIPSTYGTSVLSQKLQSRLTEKNVRQCTRLEMKIGIPSLKTLDMLLHFYVFKWNLKNHFIMTSPPALQTD